MLENLCGNKIAYEWGELHENKNYRNRELSARECGDK